MIRHCQNCMNCVSQNRMTMCRYLLWPNIKKGLSLSFRNLKHSHVFREIARRCAKYVSMG